MLPAVLLGLPCSAHVWPAIASDRREGDTDRQDCKQSKAKQQHAEGVAAEKGRPAGAKGRQLQMRLRVHLLRCKVSRPMGGFPCMPLPSTQDGLPQNKHANGLPPIHAPRLARAHTRHQLLRLLQCRSPQQLRPRRERERPV